MKRHFFLVLFSIAPYVLSLSFSISVFGDLRMLAKSRGDRGGGRTNHEAMSKYTTGVGTFLCRFICLCFRCICFVYQVFILICFKDQPNNHAA